MVALSRKTMDFELLNFNIFAKSISESVLTKEYISLLEWTAPSFVFRGKHSPNLSPLCLQYCILHYLSVCITAVSACGERLGESFLRKTKGGGCLF